MIHHHDHHPNITNFSKHHNDDDNDSQGKLVDRRDNNNPPIRSESNTSKSEKHLKSKQVNLHPNHPSAAKYSKVQQQQQQQQKQSKDKGSLKPKQVITAKEASKPTESNKGFDLKEFRKQRDDERKQLRLTMQERRKMLQMNRASLMPLLEEDDDSLLEMDNQSQQLDLGEDEGGVSSVDIHGESENTVANDDDEDEEEDLIDLHEVLGDDDDDHDDDGTDIVGQSINRQQQQQQRLLAQTFVLQVQQNGQQSLAMQEEQESLQEYDILIDQLQSILVAPTHTGLDDHAHAHAHGDDHRDGEGAELCEEDDRLLVEDSDEFEEESTRGDDDLLGMIEEEEVEDGDGDEWDLEQCDATDDAADKKSSDLPPQLYLYTADVRLLERMQPPSTSNHKQYDSSNNIMSPQLSSPSIKKNRSISSMEMNQDLSVVDNDRSTASSKKLRAEEIEEYLCSRIGASKLTQALQLLAETTTLSMKMSHNNNYNYNNINNNNNMNIGGGSYDDKDEDLLNRIEGIIGNDCLHYLDDMLMLLTLKEHKLSS
jgi:hypothetical protein